MSILIGIVIGLFIGATIGFIICTMLRKMHSYAGVMKIIREDDKLVYSLELHEDPIMLEHVSEVIFKVETSDESSNRK